MKTALLVIDVQQGLCQGAMVAKGQQGADKKAYQGTDFLEQAAQQPLQQKAAEDDKDGNINAVHDPIQAPSKLTPPAVYELFH